MAWNRNLTNLNYLLAGLYPLTEDSYRIVDAAGLPKSHIAFSRRSIDNWHAILSEAEKRNKVLALIEAARADFPENEALAQAERGELSNVNGPILGKDLTWKPAPNADPFEKVIGSQSSLVPVSFLELGLQRARSVGRVVLASGGLGSGFLVDNNLLLTNHHVIRSADEARTARVEFNYQQNLAGLPLAAVALSFDPDQGFATSQQDDWTAIRMQGAANAEWGAIPLEPAEVAVNDRVNIIQHPGGRLKQLSFYHNVVAYADAKRIQYLTDTEPGSSGSPVFDPHWRLVAVHHSGGWIPEPATNTLVFRNEGIGIGCVIEGLRQHGLLA